jgi:hypothetical protein
MADEVVRPSPAAPCTVFHQWGVNAMTDPIKVCTDRSLSAEQLVEASRRAIQETPENVPTVTTTALPGVYTPQPEEIAILTGKKWQTGRTLRVRFLDGLPSVQTKVENLARQWSNFANISFEFGAQANADIRISFSPGGSWSYLGTDVLVIPQNEQTMNFGWLTPSSSDDEISRVTLHEFGHALSAIHEHQSPAANIPWDTQAVYAYYMAPPNSWTKEQIDRNIFSKYSSTLTNASSFDPESIMLYAIPNSLTIGDYEVGWNRVLSATDKSFIGAIYPRSTPAVTQLAVSPPYARASIGTHAEQDVFTFTVAQAGSYSVETFGPTDVVMALLGPDSDTRLIAEDNDSGSMRNARIIAALTPGRYVVRIRHFRPTGTGEYEIAVRRGS